MVKSIIVIWTAAVVAFFVLWAILAKVIQKISEKKGKKQASAGPVDESDNEGKDEDVSGEIP